MADKTIYVCPECGSYIGSSSIDVAVASGHIVTCSRTGCSRLRNEDKPMTPRQIARLVAAVEKDDDGPVSTVCDCVPSGAVDPIPREVYGRGSGWPRTGTHPLNEEQHDA